MYFLGGSTKIEIDCCGDLEGIATNAVDLLEFKENFVNLNQIILYFGELNFLYCLEKLFRSADFCRLKKCKFSFYLMFCLTVLHFV